MASRYIYRQHPTGYFRVNPRFAIHEDVKRREKTPIRNPCTVTARSPSLDDIVGLECLDLSQVVHSFDATVCCSGVHRVAMCGSIVILDDIVGLECLDLSQVVHSFDATSCCSGVYHLAMCRSILILDDIGFEYLDLVQIKISPHVRMARDMYSVILQCVVARCSVLQCFTAGSWMVGICTV